MRRALAATVLAAALAGLGSGCSGGTQIGTASVVTVYVSMPERGPSGTDGRDVADGARLALEQANSKAGGLAVHAVYLDDTRGNAAHAMWSSAQVGENARQATEDSTAIAYVGDFESGATRTSEPITNEANLLQVSPASGAVELTRPFAGSTELPQFEQESGKRTFGRMIPDDDAQGRAVADWVRKLGLHRVGDLVKGRSAFAKAVKGGYSDAGGKLVRKAPFDALFYAGTAAAEPSAPITGSAGFRGNIIGTDALLPPWNAGAPVTAGLAASAALDPSQLPPAGQRFARDFRSRFAREPGRYAAYGYEAMAVVLDSIDRAAGDTISRQGVIDAFFNTVDRRSILGTYSIDAVGNTTLDKLTGFRLRGGKFVPSAILKSR